MNNATIHSTAVTLSSSLDAVEVTARLVSGIVRKGMFLRIPLNGMLDITVLIEQVTVTDDGVMRLVLNCNKDALEAELLMDFHFDDETLQVTEDGELWG